MRPPYDYLCTKCAMRLGGQWPKGHIATMHLDACERCNETEGLAHVRNWTWPKREEPVYQQRDDGEPKGSL